MVGNCFDYLGVDYNFFIGDKVRNKLTNFYRLMFYDVTRLLDVRNIFRPKLHCQSIFTGLFMKTMTY